MDLFQGSHEIRVQYLEGVIHELIKHHELVYNDCDLCLSISTALASVPQPI